MIDTGQARNGDSLPPSTALLLVAVMPSPRDLEIARVLGWYRIPFRFAPKIVHVDYLAFYQPASFGKEHANRIEYFSAVRGVELALRREIIRDEPDHPRADEGILQAEPGKIGTAAGADTGRKMEARPLFSIPPANCLRGPGSSMTWWSGPKSEKSCGIPCVKKPANPNCTRVEMRLNLNSRRISL